MPWDSLLRAGSVRQIARVDDNDEVGAGIDFIEEIAGALVISVVAKDDDEMAASGKAKYADAFGVDAPLGRVSASETHRLLGVLEIRRIFGEVTRRKGHGTSPVRR